jgi:DNA-binding CsgD family transcriptional regulator
MDAETEPRTVSIEDIFPGVLTLRERQVLALTMKGHSMKLVGMSLGISHRTVEDHRLNIYRKTGLDNMLALSHRILGAPKVVA